MTRAERASVLVVGQAVLDVVLSVPALPAAAEKYRAEAAAIVGGGCAANAAVAVARLGGAASLAARLGDDPVGRMIVEGLRAEGVDCALVRRTPGAQSSFSSIVVDARGERQIVNFRGAGLRDDAAWLDGAPVPGAILADTRWIEGARAALRLARAHRVPGVLDAEAPIDPDLLPLASHIAFSRPGLASVSALDDPFAALRDVAGRTDAWLCVTDGGAGVWVLDHGRETHVPARRISVRDTLGAGDVWHGAFTLRLAEGADEITAVRFANAAAALKCTRFGGREGCPDRAETETFLRETM